MSVQSVALDAAFRHSAGALGSHFFRTLRDDARLLGWKTGKPSRVVVPPRDSGEAGEWVDIGPGGRLAAYAPPAWTPEADQRSDASVLALVEPDGADTAMLARLRIDGDEMPSVGRRLILRFATERSGAMSDFWFELVR
jgi:uncharacterized OB-fold protein